MIGGVLSVLKIVGIVLLILLAVILVLLLIILFYPISFYVNATIDETDLSKDAFSRLKAAARADAGFRWLFRLVRGEIAFPQDERFTVRVLWMKWPKEEKAIKSEKKPEKKREEKKDAPRQETSHNAKQSGQQTTQIEEPIRHTNEKKDTNTVQAQRESRQRTASKTAPQKPHPQAETATESEKEPTLPRFLAAFFHAFYILLTKPYEVFWNLQYTISSVCDRIDQVRAFLQSAVFLRAKDVLLAQLKRLLKGIRPKRMQISLLYGTGDPALSAEILAFYSTLYPFLGKYCTVDTDFERRVLKLDAHIKGRVTLFRLLTCAGIVYFNKDVRKALKRGDRILHPKKERQ